jgi:polyisoprenoid-binding protein YceI
MLARSTLAALLLVATSAAAAATDGTYAVKAQDSTVRFLATGKPGFLKIDGEGAHVEGQARIAAGKVTGTFLVALDELHTGIDLRDEHMKAKYLETGKFPKAQLVLDPTPVDLAAGKQERPFTGKLTLKGVEKPVQGTLTLEPSDSSVKGDATFEIKLSDYPIGVPSHLGVSVAETVKIEVAIVAGAPAA